MYYKYSRRRLRCEGASYPALRALALLLVHLCAQTCYGQYPSKAMVSGQQLIVMVVTDGSMYALAPHTSLASIETVLEGTRNRQPDEYSCAESCQQHAGCTAFYFWCEGPRNKELGRCTSLGYCSLVVASTAYGVTVFQMAASENEGTTGVKMLAAFPGVIPGYTDFYAQSLYGNMDLDLQCESETLAAGSCVLQLDLEEAASHCDKMPKCQAFDYTPAGLGNLPGPMASFKGSSNGALVDMSESSLSPVTTLYVKDGQLSQGPPQLPGSNVTQSDGGDSGLSGGAIAGIVGGAACVGMAIVGVGLLLWRRQSHARRQARQGRVVRKTNAGADMEAQHTEHDHSSKSTVGSGIEADAAITSGLSPAQLSALEGAFDTNRYPKLPSGSSKAKLFAEAQGLQWKDALVPRDSIQLSTDASGSLIKLGGGASGDVFKASFYDHECACKVYEFKSLDCGSAKYFIKEVRMLWRLNHPNVVNFLGACVTDTQGLLLMELAVSDLGSMKHKEAEGGQGGRLYSWWNRGARVVYDVAVGISYLHAANVCHLDVKDSNVLLMADGSAKLGDVGFSRIVKHNGISSMGNGMGTFDFCAPEILLGQSASYSADMYSFGILLWQICTGERPRRGSLRKLIVPQDCPPEIAELELRCTDADPALRPSAKEVVQVLRRFQSGPQRQGSTGEEGAAANLALRQQGSVGEKGAAATVDPQGSKGSEEKASGAAGSAPKGSTQVLRSVAIHKGSGAPSPLLVTGDLSVLTDAAGSVALDGSGDSKQ